MATLYPPNKAVFKAFDWTNMKTLSVDAPDVGASQSPSITIMHVVYVYYTNTDPTGSENRYHFIHHMKIALSAGGAFSKRDSVKGFFLSGIFVSYPVMFVKIKNKFIVPTLITKSPVSGSDAFDTVLRGQQQAIRLNADTGTGSIGGVTFEPTYELRNNIPSWTINATTEPSGPAGGIVPGWHLYQEKPWNGSDMSDAGGTNAKRLLLDQIFNKSPWGNIVDMPDSSYGTINFELISQWRVEPGFASSDRAATLIISNRFDPRLTLFHNAKSKEPEAHRHTCTPSFQTDLKEIDLSLASAK